MIEKHANPASYRYLPFAVFMVFIALDESVRYLAGLGLFRLGATTLYYLYPVKTVMVGWLLYLFRKHYHEFAIKDFANLPVTLISTGVGLLVFVLWIRMDWTLAPEALQSGFNPTLLQDKTIQVAMTVFRIVGAVLVVPLMEELFWRSFLIRTIISKDFDTVQIGSFTWASFLITTILFGLEHNYVIAGIMAGIIYNLLLYTTRSLAQCVLAHTTTNLALAIYVVSTGAWRFW